MESHIKKIIFPYQILLHTTISSSHKSFSHARN